MPLPPPPPLAEAAVVGDPGRPPRPRRVHTLPRVSVMGTEFLCPTRICLDCGHRNSPLCRRVIDVNPLQADRMLEAMGRSPHPCGAEWVRRG